MEAAMLRSAPRAAAQEEPYVRFRNVQKTYDGETLVVKNLNLDIAKGEFLTMLGPSGSGKTTSLMMLAGFETATHGEIYLDGRPINALAPERRNIGMVFQNYALFPHMTVAENLAFPLKVRKISASEIEAKVKRALDMVGLGGFASRRPGQMSGGQAQRVAVARALVFEPKLVLMDEPLSALDKQLREQMQYEVKAIHDRLGVTIVYVTHDQSEALTMSDRIAVFNEGVIQQLDTPERLYEAPVNSFVARFIGENNRISGDVLRLDGDECVVEMKGCGAVQAARVAALQAGAPTMLSLRPERVQIDPPEGSVPNAFEATVRDLVYLGDHLRIGLDLGGRNTLVAKMPNSSRHGRLAPGHRVRVGWHAADCRALDAPRA
ncbi:ABC transporter ATP-binding protein [Aromatoleum petrolei]|nr:ABC transporter ATP-binding protein [Aromatoleum petrolei]